MLKYICKLYLKITGFRVTGVDPETIDKKLFIVYPHTSNWDFPLGIAVKFGTPITVNYIAKDALFKPPHGFIFRWLGGIPVNRSKRSNFVDTMVNLYNTNDKLSLAISPEGTRKKVHKFKTGFYHIAHNAKVPIMMVKFDYGKKEVFFGEPFYTSGVYSDDLKFIIEFFEGTQGKIKENVGDWSQE